MTLGAHLMAKLQSIGQGMGMLVQWVKGCLSVSSSPDLPNRLYVVASTRLPRVRGFVEMTYSCLKGSQLVRA